MASHEEHIPDNEQTQEVESVDSATETTVLKQQLLILGADFQNYKKRVEKERGLWMHSAQEDLLKGLLPVVDNFERALTEAQKSENDASLGQWIKGFELIHKNLCDFLNKNGVVPLSNHTVFDPELHEAVMHVQSSEHKSGDIVTVFERGFMFKDKVLRPSKVSVAQ